jgi:hypothetical protein
VTPVAGKFHDHYMGILSLQRFEQIQRAILGAVVHIYDFPRYAGAFQGGCYSLMELND